MQNHSGTAVNLSFFFLALLICSVCIFWRHAWQSRPKRELCSRSWTGKRRFWSMLNRTTIRNSAIVLTVNVLHAITFWGKKKNARENKANHSIKNAHWARDWEDKTRSMCTQSNTYSLIDGADNQSSHSNDGLICVFRATHAHKKAAEASIKLASITASDVIYDLGCGDARSLRAIY